MFLRPICWNSVSFLLLLFQSFARCFQKWKLMVVLYLDTKQILISRVGCVRLDSWINLVGSSAMQQAQTFRDKKLGIRRVFLWKYCILITLLSHFLSLVFLPIKIRLKWFLCHNIRLISVHNWNSFSFLHNLYLSNFLLIWFSC